LKCRLYSQTGANLTDLTIERSGGPSSTKILGHLLCEWSEGPECPANPALNHAGRGPSLLSTPMLVKFLSSAEMKCASQVQVFRLWASKVAARASIRPSRLPIPSSSCTRVIKPAARIFHRVESGVDACSYFHMTPAKIAAAATKTPTCPSPI